MHRRTFISGLLAALLVPTIAGRSTNAQAKVNRTRWKVRTSEGFDAIAFLGPLSGTQLYLDDYAEDASAFAPRLAEAVRGDIARLWDDARNQGFGLLGPNLQVLFSANGADETLQTLLTALGSRATAILPGYKASSYWNEADWAWFDGAAPRLDAIFSAMQDADFASFRRDRIGTGWTRAWPRSPGR